MKKSFFVSVVTPNYNGAKYLEKTLQSVFNQSEKNFEYIVVDGISTDGSIKILKKYKEKINRLIIEKDRGIYDAIEKGINLAKGEVVLWINSDDILHKNAVKNISILFKKKKNLKWLCGINGYIKYGFNFYGIPYVYPNFILKKGFARHDLWGYLQQESTVFRKSLFIAAGGFGVKPTIAGDYKLWKKFSKYSNLETFNIKIGSFRTHPDQNSVKSLREYRKNSNVYFRNFSFRFIRLALSLVLYPYIFFKTLILIKSK